MSNPEDYELIATLWYSVIENSKPNAQSVAYQTEPVTIAFDNIRSIYSNPSDPLGFAPLGNNFTISYKSVKTPTTNTNSAITFPSFKETFIINVPTGTIEASCVYFDRSLDATTTVDENIFTVTGGRGLFNDASIAIIKYDNTGEIFGYPGSRRIEVYKLK